MGTAPAGGLGQTFRQLAKGRKLRPPTFSLSRVERARIVLNGPSTDLCECCDDNLIVVSLAAKLVEKTDKWLCDEVAALLRAGVKPMEVTRVVVQMCTTDVAGIGIRAACPFGVSVLKPQPTSLTGRNLLLHKSHMGNSYSLTDSFGYSLAVGSRVSK